ncbi:shikimate dehydrogenase [Salinibacillus kushneri]|uniref:Shikimate dehydrogenase (NADP(+)) n=1 Tax=Salinibacillus kushneri TaxID=237682 RepID=A0A1I0G4I6_9BACI|nr:shikimate dehydrogenase [Salinibacillus kushneri]SET65537.1 shikimate dehydrogenase [Salinibacillus kushneri]
MGYLLGVIGNPIKHTLSPWIHQQFMNETSINGIYRPYEIKEDELKESFNLFKKMNIDGFNVTIPYKETMLHYVDDLDERARSIGAVNTVVNQGGKWIGYNTDGRGYIRSLKQSYADLDTFVKNVLLIGAGGAARGIYDALNQESFPVVDIANRTRERAEGLLDSKENHVETSIYSLKEAQQNLQQYDLIIQTTSMGMTPNNRMMPIDLQNIKENTIVSDIIYNPIETSLLQTARKKGARIHYGHGMLLHQAALAFELWTGKTIDPNHILHELEQKLKGGSTC